MHLYHFHSHLCILIYCWSGLEFAHNRIIAPRWAETTASMLNCEFANDVEIGMKSTTKSDGRLSGMLVHSANRNLPNDGHIYVQCIGIGIFSLAINQIVAENILIVLPDVAKHRSRCMLVLVWRRACGDDGSDWSSFVQYRVQIDWYGAMRWPHVRHCSRWLSRYLTRQVVVAHVAVSNM